MRMLTLVGALVLWLSGCGKGSSTQVPPQASRTSPALNSDTPTQAPPIFLTRATISRNELRQQLGNAFGDQARLFRQALSNLSAGLENSCSTLQIYDQRQTQESWAEAMLIWQRLEVMQVGPLAEQRGSLRQQIYNWPKKVDTCAVDAQIVDLARRPRSFSLPASPERKGLKALEHLLFAESFKPTCSFQGARPQNWERLSERERRGALCTYEKALVKALIRDADKILERWGPSDAHPFMGDTRDEAEANAQIQGLFNNLFTLDKKVRPLKIEAPAGLSKEFCSRSPDACPELEEFPRSQLSAAAIRANVDGMRSLMLGPLVGRRYAGGFTALLRAEGGGAAADKLEDQIMALSNLAESSDKTLRELIADHYGEACELHNYDSWICRMDKSIRELNEGLRTEMAPVLSLKVPKLGQSQ